QRRRTGHFPAGRAQPLLSWWKAAVQPGARRTVPGQPRHRLPRHRPARRRGARHHPPRLRRVPGGAPRRTARPGRHVLAGGVAERRRRTRGRAAYGRRLRGAGHPRRSTARGHRAQRRLPPRLAPARAGALRGPGPRGPQAGRLGPPPDGRTARAAVLVRPRDRPYRQRRRRPDHRGRPERPGHRPARPRTPGAPVLVESPTYPGMLAAARATGLRPVPVPMDADGVRPELLADAFRATGARVLVTQPLFQNPTGATLAPARRPEILAIARAAGAFVVEDDFARRLVHDDSAPLPAPLAADDPDGTVVHVCSLTKVTSPSLRVGALAARGPVLERLRAIQVVDSFFVPRPLQEAALELVGSPSWGRHLAAVATELRHRRTTLATALGSELPELVLPHLPAGGGSLWLRLPGGGAGDCADEPALVSAALRASVAIAPGRPYFCAEPPAGHVRLSFAAVSGAAEIAEGVRRLRTAFDGLLGG
ncbi:LOW QUALITY PROTEIN: transcriptional regulator, partial [Streptomyces filamentosus NRRL 15998]